MDIVSLRYSWCFQESTREALGDLTIQELRKLTTPELKKLKIGTPKKFTFQKLKKSKYVDNPYEQEILNAIFQGGNNLLLQSIHEMELNYSPNMLHGWSIIKVLVAVVQAIKKGEGWVETFGNMGINEFYAQFPMIDSPDLKTIWIYFVTPAREKRERDEMVIKEISSNTTLSLVDFQNGKTPLAEYLTGFEERLPQNFYAQYFRCSTKEMWDNYRNIRDAFSAAEDDDYKVVIRLLDQIADDGFRNTFYNCTVVGIIESMELIIAVFKKARIRTMADAQRMYQLLHSSEEVSPNRLKKVQLMLQSLSMRELMLVLSILYFEV